MSLELNDIYGVLKEILPERNNFYPCSYSEEFEELMAFGIDSTEKLATLLNKHLVAIMEEDSTVEVAEDEATYDYYCEELGKEVVEERIEGGYWFSWPALLRLALEAEFGEKYIAYAYERDGIEEE